MKNIGLTLILAASCLVLRAQHAESDYLYTTKSFQNASPKKIVAGTSHGNITVSDVPASQTWVEVYVHSNNNYNQILSKQEIQKRLDEYYTLEISLSADVLNASARQKIDNILNESGLSISFVIYTPKAASSVLKTSHGNINLTGLEGSQDAETSHGNITISKITGKLVGQTSHGNVSITDCKNDIEVSTDHGDVTGSNCEGTIKMTTSHGNIDLRNLKGKVRAGTDHGNVSCNTIAGELTASTSHGNVDLDATSCSINASTDHGDISVTAIAITGEIVTHNGNGNINMELPKGKGLDLDLQGKEVSVDGLQNFNGTKSKDLVNGTINGGGIKISTRTDRDAHVSFK
jgi:Putative adhesin